MRLLRRYRLVRQRRLTAREQQGETGLLHDPIEDDPTLTDAIAEAQDKADAELSHRPKTRGYCQRRWRMIQTILRREYDVEWFSPAEMNPHVLFD